MSFTTLILLQECKHKRKVMLAYISMVSGFVDTCIIMFIICVTESVRARVCVCVCVCMCVCVCVFVCVYAFA